MALLPAFHTRVYSGRYGPLAMDVYHGRAECQNAQRILKDHEAVMGKGGRRMCAECRRIGLV